MARIFIYLSVANIILLFGVMMIGWLGWKPAPERHIILAVLTLLLSSFMQVLTFTYFNVTGKVVTQALHLSSADLSPIFQQKRIKYTFMWLLAILVGSYLFSVATGATGWRTRNVGYEHLLAAGVSIVAHCFVLMREYSLIVDNTAIVKEVLRTYEEGQKSRHQDGEKQN